MWQKQLAQTEVVRKPPRGSYVSAEVQVLMRIWPVQVLAGVFQVRE
jgi:hypothetical protein